MKVFHPDKKLIRILASEIKEDKKPIRIVAQGQNTALDEATESAKAYWMMGWTWEEIDAILEDAGFSAKAIASAIKAAQKYAFECLKDGPFKPLKEGQLVKLKNGFVGTLVNKYVGHISVKGSEDKVEVTEDKIDFETSAKLQKAYTLRESAKRIMKEAQEDVYFTEQEKMMQVPGAPPKGVTVSPDPEEKWEKPYTKERTPSGWAEQTPEMSNVDEVTNLATAALQDLDALLIEKQKWEAENKELVKMGKEIKSKLRELEKQEAEVAQNIFGIISAEGKALDDLDVKVFNKYKNKLIGLERALKTAEFKPTWEEELTGVYDFLQLNHPEIVKDLMETMDFWRKQHTALKETITSKFHYYTPPKEKMGQVINTNTSWISDIWNKTKQFFNKLMNETFPLVDEGIAKMDELEGVIGMAQTATKIKKALRVTLK